MTKGQRYRDRRAMIDYLGALKYHKNVLAIICRTGLFTPATCPALKLGGTSPDRLCDFLLSVGSWSLFHT